MEKSMTDLAKMLLIVAACPSSGYCLRAQRLDCGACPANPVKTARQQQEQEEGSGDE